MTKFSERFNELLLNLKTYRELHFELGERVLKADDSAVYPLDLLIIASLNRSLCLLKGFIYLLEDKNFIAAAPLLRLQIDNCLRISAGTLVNKPHEFAIKILEGNHVRKMFDKDGHKMTDRYLLENLSRDNPWIINVYEQTSGYIHLSEKHIFNAINTGKEERVLSMKITDEDAFIPNEVYEDTVENFTLATDLLFRFIGSWAFTKDDPKKTAEIRLKRKLDNRKTG